MSDGHEILIVNASLGDKKFPFIQRRLDYWLVSDSNQEEVERVDIISSVNSDHSAIVLHFNIIEKQKFGFYIALPQADWRQIYSLL